MLEDLEILICTLVHAREMHFFWRWLRHNGLTSSAIVWGTSRTSDYVEFLGISLYSGIITKNIPYNLSQLLQWLRHL